MKVLYTFNNSIYYFTHNVNHPYTHAHHKYLIMRYNQVQSSTISEGVWDPNSFKAIFMAGAPASGKSTVRRRLFGHTDLKVVDADEVRGYYMKMKALEKIKDAGDYGLYGARVRSLRSNYMNQRLGLLLDTTAWWLPSVKETTQQLQELGYDVGMVHVFVPLQQSLARAKTRAETPGRDYGRVVDQNEIIMRYEQVKHNVRDFIELFDDAYWFVENSGSKDQLIHKCDDLWPEIRNWLAQPTQNPQAIDWIHSQLRSSQTQAK